MMQNLYMPFYFGIGRHINSLQCLCYIDDIGGKRCVILISTVGLGAYC